MASLSQRQILECKREHDRFNVSQSTLYDIRDGESYQIRKLADGNCWMTENLRLIGPRTLTQSDSDLTAGRTFSITASNGGTWRTTTPAKESEVNVANVYYANNTSNGAYYNWYSATAGSGVLATTGDANDSICPHGWQLPNGNTDWRNITGSYGYLWYNAYGIFSTNENSPKLTQTPLSFVLAGFYPWSSVANTTYGFYATRSTYEQDNNYIIVASFVKKDDSDRYGLNAFDRYEKSSGLNIRCLAR